MTNQGRLDFGPRLRPARIMLPRSAWLLIIAGRFGLLSAAHAEPDNLRAPTAPIETATQLAESAIGSREMGSFASPFMIRPGLCG